MSFIGFVIGAISLAAAMCVVGLRNPLYSAFALVVNLLAVAGLYASLDAHFLAASQIVVYAGAIMVLVLFVLMLLNIKAESGRKLGFLRSAFALVVGVGILLTALPPILGHFSDITSERLSDNMRDSNGTVKAMGREIYTSYVAHFELASVVILIGVVGAVMLAKRKRGELAPREGGLIAGSINNQ